jgi:multidrug efflux system outer membrane protein
VKGRAEFEYSVECMTRLLLLILLATQIACAPLAEFKRPVAPVPAVWSAAPAAPAFDASRVHWDRYFVDPRLRALIAAALQNNRDLKVAISRVQEARAQFGIARADSLPALNLLGRASLDHTASQGLASTSTSERYDLSLSSVSFEADFWGRIANLTEAARNSYLASEDARRAVQLSLIAEVANAYFMLSHHEAQLKLARETVHLRAQSLEIIGRGLDIGASYDLELQESAALLESARSVTAALQHQINVSTHQLDFLVGHAQTDLPQGLALDEQALESDLAPGLPAEVLLLRPDVMAAEKRLAASHANVAAARAAFLPKVVLTASMGLASAGLSSLFQSGAWAFQPAISLPLFDGGRLNASMDLAQARKLTAVADYERTIQQAFREVADQLSSRASLAAQMRSALAVRQAQLRRLEITQARYRAGLIGYLEVLEAEREALAAHQTSTQLRRAQLEAATQLYKALGGGSQTSAPA